MLQFTGVSGFDSMDAVIRIMAIALPIAVLLTLLLVLSTKRRVKLRHALDQSATNENTLDAHEPARNLPLAAVSSAAAPEAPATLLTENPVEDMHARIKNKIAREPRSAHASLYLDLARLHRSQGDEPACMTALRTAAGLAAQHGPRSAHAEARLELAEAAYKTGDLTGACEQWQIARTALLDDGQKDAHTRVDNRMRDNGCPTDWVLTDF
jgi:hypothetical protein